MTVSMHIIRQQLRHVLDDEDAALRAMRELPDGEYLKALCSRRAKLHNALKAINDMLEGRDDDDR